MKAIIFVITFNLINLMSLQSIEAQVTEQWAKEIIPPGRSIASGNATAVDINGFVYSLGNANNDMVLVKYNLNGDTAWTRIFDSGPDDRGHDVTVDNSGNVYVTGPSWSNTTSADAVIIKYNSNGDSLWVRKYSRTSFNDWILKIKVDQSGNIYAAGHSERASGNYDYFIIKYNSSGVFQWDRFYNGAANANDYFGGLDLDKSGNVFITGSSGTGSSQVDLVTIKYDPAGTLLWLHKYAGTPSAGAGGSCVKTDELGNAYVCGTAGLGGNYITIKYNSNGDTLWTRMYNGECNGNLSDFATSLAVDASGNVFVTGGSMSCFGTNYDFATVKYNSNGTQQWVKRYNGSGYIGGGDYGKAVCVDASGDAYVAGQSFETFLENFATIKYDKDGNQKWLKIFGNSSGTYKLNNMIIDNSGNVFVTGFSPAPLSSTKLATVKYSQSNLKLTALIEGMYDNSLDKMVQDTATVFLRNVTSPFDIVDTVKSVLDSTGKGIFIFKNTTPGTSYYAVIKHRNSVETWSSSGITMSTGSVNYDFTTGSSKAYGNNLVQKGNRYCIYSGELNDDGYIDLTDMISINNDVAGSKTGYRLSDLNGDRNSDLTDLLIAYNNSSNFVTAITPSAANPGMSPSSVVKTTVEKYSVVLKDNYPNPFNPSTVITFQLPASGVVSLKVYDMTGREVTTLVNEVKNAGEHSVTFNASGLSSGMYFYKLNANGLELVKEMMLVK